ncbi:MAG: hypothetical protein HKN06_03570 [Gammaproteobacteria bacterium]|nr:hypothetical protein [Gammaproteobacteria bacterium]
MTHRKILVIGFDSAEPTLLDEWCGDGTLPNLKSLRDRSAWASVSYPPFLGSGAIWPSLLTGVTPATHGRYFFLQIKPGTYEQYSFPREQLASRPLWDVLSENGKRCIVVDVPKFGLNDNINGVQVVDWMVHDRRSQTPQVTPKRLSDELISNYGLDSISRCDSVDPTPEGLGALYASLARRIRLKTEFTTDLLKKEDWDLCCTVFHDPHCIGHQSWHARDSKHPRHDNELSNHVGDPVRKVYLELDRAVGRLLDCVDTDTLVVFFSGPGMGPNYTGNHLLEAVLGRLDQRRPKLGRRLMMSARHTWHRLPRRIKFFQPLRKRAKNAADAADARGWADCTFFPVPHNDIAGAIRLNVAGREPQGVVQPGEHFDRVLHQLRQDLLELRNLETDEPMVSSVCLSSEYFDRNCPHFDELPDVFVNWNRNAPISRVGSTKAGIVAGEFRARRTGDHTPNAVIFAAHGNIQAGEMPEPVNLYAIAPTLAAHLGVAMNQAEAQPDIRFGATARGIVP